MTFPLDSGMHAKQPASLLPHMGTFSQSTPKLSLTIADSGGPIFKAGASSEEDISYGIVSW